MTRKLRAACARDGVGEVRQPPARRRFTPWVTDRVAPGVVYTTFHHPLCNTNVVTTDNSDWATNCPEYKVTAVQISKSNGPTEFQEKYRELSEQARRIATTIDAAE